MGVITLTTNGTAYQLSALVEAASQTAGASCAGVSLQVNPDAGNVRVRVGNANITSTVWGATLLAGGSISMATFGTNSIGLKAIWLLSDTDGVKVGVTIIII